MRYFGHNFSYECRIELKFCQDVGLLIPDNFCLWPFCSTTLFEGSTGLLWVSGLGISRNWTLVILWATWQQEEGCGWWWRVWWQQEKGWSVGLWVFKPSHTNWSLSLPISLLSLHFFLSSPLFFSWHSLAWRKHGGGLLEELEKAAAGWALVVAAGFSLFPLSLFFLSLDPLDDFRGF